MKAPLDAGFSLIRPTPGRRRAALVWSGDLSRALQQILFDAADGIAPPDPAWASSADVKF